MMDSPVSFYEVMIDLQALHPTPSPSPLRKEGRRANGREEFFPLGLWETYASHDALAWHDQAARPMIDLYQHPPAQDVDSR